MDRPYLIYRPHSIYWLCLHLHYKFREIGFTMPSWQVMFYRGHRTSIHLVNKHIDPPSIFIKMDSLPKFIHLQPKMTNISLEYYFSIIRSLEKKRELLPPFLNDSTYMHNIRNLKTTDFWLSKTPWVRSLRLTVWKWEHFLYHHVEGASAVPVMRL